MFREVSKSNSRGGAEGDEEVVSLCKISSVSLLFKGECKSVCAMSSMWLSYMGGADRVISGPVGVDVTVGGLDRVEVVGRFTFLWACNFKMFLELSYCLYIDCTCRLRAWPWVLHSVPLLQLFYMGDLEKRVFENQNNKPVIYARYVDDIFVQIENETELIALKQLFQSNSVLNFTYELNVDNKLPFLDVLVDTNNNEFHTSVYHKPTDHGKCLNARSECVDKYKNSVITNYLNRAYKVSSTWEEFHIEVKHIKKKLVNINYSNTVVDSQIKIFLEKKLATPQNEQEN